VRVLEEELAVKLVVLFVECPAGDEYSNPHTSFAIVSRLNPEKRPKM
jgi:hypothetical protein